MKLLTIFKNLFILTYMLVKMYAKYYKIKFFMFFNRKSMRRNTPHETMQEYNPSMTNEIKSPSHYIFSRMNNNAGDINVRDEVFKILEENKNELNNFEHK